MKKDKIFELRIEEDDEVSGIDSISLVSEPAIEINWVAFKKEKPEHFHIPNGEDDRYLMKLMEYGQSEQELLDNGYVVHSVGNFSVDKFFETYPNADSEFDTDEFLIRYKYSLNPEASGQRPIEATTRPFCRELVNRNMVFRIEDMDRLTNDEGDPAIVWRGGYNCRHSWVKILYRKDTKIVNKASVNKGKILNEGIFPADMVPDLTILDYEQPDTRTSHPSFSKEKFGYPLFETKEEAEAYAILIGCSGSHEHKYGDKVLYMPCEEHPEDLGYDNVLPPYVDELPTGKTKQDFETYNDYPESASNNACKVLRWRDEHGDEVKGMTQVGWTRANQLCKKENISEETIARMSAFQRHRKNAEVSPEFKSTPWKDAGYVAWLGWGGTTGIEWASRKLESIRNQKMSKQKFQIDDEKKIVVGPAMVPDMKIFRKDKNGEPYYVFFTTETIKMVAEKYMRKKYIDNNDTEHNGEVAEDVYVIESWIKEDDQDKSNKYGYEELPIGTWFVSMKVRNQEVWDRIKNKELNGFSVSGLFEEVEQFYKEQEFLKELVEILKEV